MEKKDKMLLLSLDAELLFPLRQFPFSAQTLGFSYEMKLLKYSKFQTKFNICGIRANFRLQNQYFNVKKSVIRPGYQFKPLCNSADLPPSNDLSNFST